MPGTKRSRRVAGLLCVAIGLLPISIALGWIPVAESSLHAPMWVLALSGVVFVIAGGMIFLADESRTKDFLAGVLCLLFAILGAWVALLGRAEGFSGGLPFLSGAANTALGRWVFGIGALLSLAISAYAFRRAFQSSR